MKTAKYQDLKFASDVELQDWLNQTAMKQIEFKDNGQDLLRIWIDGNGEILHCNCQSSVWNGMFCLPHFDEVYAIDENAVFQFHDGSVYEMDFIIETVTNLITK